jgi:hypothetical protein
MVVTNDLGDNDIRDLGGNHAVQTHAPSSLRRRR